MSLVKETLLHPAVAALRDAGHTVFTAAETPEGSGGEPLEAATSPLARTPEPPYYAVIFTSVRTDGDRGYARTAAKMADLARRQPGFLGMESARNPSGPAGDNTDGTGITVSYWSDLASIENWKNQADHLTAQKMGKKAWYETYTVRITRVERVTVFPS